MEGVAKLWWERQAKNTADWFFSLPFKVFTKDDMEKPPLQYNVSNTTRRDVDPKKTFKSIQFKTNDSQPTPNNDQLRDYSVRMARGELTWKERMHFAMLILQREIDGYVEEAFYSDTNEYLKNTLAEVLGMKHNMPVAPIDVTPNVNYLPSQVKWALFEAAPHKVESRWNPSRTTGVRPDPVDGRSTMQTLENKISEILELMKQGYRIR